MRDRKIVIIGVGNVLRADDGLGPYVVSLIREKIKHLENVELIDCGTGGMEVANYMQGVSKAIIVDAIQMGKKPGEIYYFKINTRIFREKREVLDLVQSVSVHEIGLKEAIVLGEILGDPPKEIVVVGCEPKDINSFRIGLSSEVEKAVPKIVEIVLREVNK